MGSVMIGNNDSRTKEIVMLDEIELAPSMKWSEYFYCSA